jgi:hypothetical protein
MVPIFAASLQTFSAWTSAVRQEAAMAVPAEWPERVDLTRSPAVEE